MRLSGLRSSVLLATMLACGSASGWAACSGSATTQTCSASVSVSAPNNSKATPYSISQAVSGLTGAVTHVHVTLTGITETGGTDNLNGMELLLVSPSGKQLVILAYPAGDATSAPPTSLLVDDTGQACGDGSTALSGAAHVLADNCNGTNQLNPGTPDGFPNVLAPGSSCTAATCVTANQPTTGMDNTFDAEAAPNGTWNLYIANSGGGTGVTFNFTGWTLEVDASGVAATGTNTAVSPANQSVFRTPTTPSTLSTAAPVTASVTSTSTVNTGSVSFFDNGVAIASCTNIAVNGSGQAVCNFQTTQEGVHPITASYLGAGGFAPSTSPLGSPAKVTVTDRTVVNGNTYCNPGSILMSGAGQAMPYPSQIFVGLNGSADLTGVITSLSLDTLQDSANDADNISVLLVSPAGSPYVIWSHAFQNLNANSGPFDIHFADGHGLLPNSGGLVAGTFSPTDYAASAAGDQGVFTAPAPQSGFFFPATTGNSQPGGPATFNTVFNGAGASGTWSLYVFDQGANNGSFAGGWCLNFTVNANLSATVTTVSASPTASYTTAPFTSKFPPIPNNDFVVFTSHTTSNNTPVATGSVTFAENNVNLTCSNHLQPVPVDASGNAVCDTTFSTEGNHIIRATYHEGNTLGDSNNTTLERVDDHSTRNPAANTVSAVTTYQYCNTGIIHIPGFSSAKDPGNPYPSNIFINDLPGTINNVTLQLTNFTVAGSVQDLTSLLVGPGQNAADSLDFFSRAGGNFAGGPVTLTFEDVSGNTLPSAGFTSGPNYKPGSLITPPTYPSLSPVGPYPPPVGSLNYAAPNGSSTFASIYGSGNANTRTGAGTWSLYQQTVNDGDTISDSNGWCLNFTVNPPVVQVTKSDGAVHFHQGQQDAQYTIDITNNGPGPTGGLLKVVDILQSGLTPAATPGTGSDWTCNSSSQTITCTIPDVIAATNSYPTLTLHANVGVNAPTSVTNQAAVTGGGTSGITQSNQTTTTIDQVAHLTVSKSHTGNFSEGQQGAQFSIVVHNSNTGGPTTGDVMIDDVLATGLTFASFSGTGWNCTPSGQDVSCTYTPVIAAGADSNTLTLSVNVASNASASIQNTATVSGGGTFAIITNATGNDTVTVTQLPDLTIAKSHSGNFSEGQQNAQFSLVVSNGGGLASSGTITVTDTLPAGMTFASGTGTGWSCNASNQVVTCTDSATPIAAGGTSTITLKVNVTPTAAASLQNSATVACTCTEGNANNNTSNTDAVTVTQLPDLTITKSHSGNFTAGQANAQFSLVVTNGGGADSSGTITVTDTLAAGFTFASGTGTGWSCSANGQLVTCTDASTPITAGGGTSAITLSVNVANNAASSLQNTAAVACTCTESVGTNNTSNTDTVTIGQLADLTIAKSHTGNFSQGQQGAQFSLVVTNGGATAATGTITVTDTLAAGLTFSSGSGTGWSCSANGQLVTCTDAATPISGSGGTSTITLNVNVANNAPASIQNTAGVACTCSESNANNNTSNTDSVTVTQLADLTLAKSHLGNFNVGQQNAQFSLVVSNGGSAASSGTITVSDTLPSGLTFASGSGTGWSCSANGQLVTCTDTATPIAAGGTSAITLNVNVANNAPASLQNTATVACTCAESNANNNTSNTDNVTVVQLPDLTIAKSHSPGNFFQGLQNAQYSLVVTNGGAIASTGTITVTDTLPGSLTFVSGTGTGWTCSANNQQVTCTDSATPIAAGGTSTITLTVKVAGNAPASLQNTAAVACSCTESNPNNNTSNTDTAPVVQLPDLTLSKSHSGAFTQGQQNAQFTLVVTNAGTGAAQGGMTVTDVLPAGLTFASGSGTGWGCNANNQTVTCSSISSLSGGATSTITLNVNVANNAPSTLQNTASVACSCQELNTNNNTSNTDTVTVGSSGNILTINVAPSGGGTTNPPSGESFGAGSVPISATPNAGYQFVNWTGGTFGNANNASTTLTMPNAPLTITANFTPLPTALGGSFGTKTGPQNARVWTVNIGNNGPGVALGASVTSFTIQQTSGAACTPVVTSSFPALAGDIAPGGTKPATVTISFTGCPSNAFFKATANISANSGAATGSIVRLNQLQ